MDRIVKGVCFDKKARLALISVTEGVRKAVQIHDMSPLSAAVYARALTAGAYINANLKSKSDRFNLIIDGKGSAGKIYIAGEDGDLKGFMENPHADAPLKNAKLDIVSAVGTDGDMVVIKDMGLKEPYIGRTKLIGGGIADDFANYLYKSEGIRSAVAFGEYITADGVVQAGGIIVEALPDAGEEITFMLEDIMSNFSSLSTMMTEKSIEEIGDFYFGHLHTEFFAPEEIRYGCHCVKKIRNIIRSLGRSEAESIIRDEGAIEITCDYCRRTYRFGSQDVAALFADG